eukprot:143998-Prymnesium_polylepis.2
MLHDVIIRNAKLEVARPGCGNALPPWDRAPSARAARSTPVSAGLARRRASLAVARVTSPTRRP